MLDDEGLPRVVPVTFAVTEGMVWSAVDSKPKRVAGERLARVRFLRRRPEAAFTVDRYSEDWERLAWVQVLGEVRVVAIDDEPEALRALAAKYEAYRASPPPGPLLGLAPRRCLTWRATG